MMLSNSPTLFLLIFLAAAVGMVFLLMRYGRKQAISEVILSGDRSPSYDYQGHLDAANRLFQEYRYQEALKHYLEAIKLNNKDEMVHYRIGRIYQSLEDYAHAETAFLNVLAITPDSVEALYELCRILLKQGKTEQALKYIDQLLRVDAGHVEGLKLKARILLESSHYREAGQIIQELLDQDGDNLELMLLLGKTYQMAGQWEEALKVYYQLLERDLRDKKNAKYYIYQIYSKQGMLDEAIQMLQDILDTGTGTINRDDIKTELAKLHCRKAVIYFQQGFYPEAIELYNQAITYDAEYAESYTGLGKVYAEQKEREQAIHYYQKALELGYQNTQAFMEMAALYEELDQFDMAIEYMKKAEVLLPSAQVYFYLGTLHGLKGDIEGCVSYLNKAVAKDPEHVDALYNLGVALEHQNKTREALGMYKRVLSLNGEHVEAKTNLKYLQTRAVK